jgi:hypothetical protein
MRHFFDPTSEDGDYVPLTPEERKAIYKGGAVMLLIVAIEALIIYLYL